MDDRFAGEDPEKGLGCLVKLQVVAYFVQPHRGDKGQEVGNDESDGDDDAESELIFGITNAEFLDAFRSRVEALVSDVGGVVALKGAEGEVADVLPLVQVLAPEQGWVGVDVLVEAGEGVEESHQEEQDLRHQGSDGGDQEAVGVVAYDRGQPDGEDRGFQREELFTFRETLAVGERPDQGVDGGEGDRKCQEHPAAEEAGDGDPVGHAVDHHEEHQREDPHAHEHHRWIRVCEVLASFDKEGSGRSPCQGEQGDDGGDDDSGVEVTGAESDVDLLNGLGLKVY